MVDIEKVIKQSEENIRQALKDYGAHTYTNEVLEDVSDAFIMRLAKDNAYAKQELRELFSQSPVYDSKLDALVINGTRTHDPDPDRIENLGYEILSQAVKFHESSQSFFTLDDVWNINYFFSGRYYSDSEKAGYIETIQRFSPKAYKEGRKLSRVFKQLCQDLGIADESAGSDFQRLYAQFADELTTKKIGFKLYASLNPAHFITMSNPKGDERGCTLTSCHSFNSTQYSYNNGCSGYARDNWTFIVFTAADPSNPETLNNRKTTRQIFAYKPGNGLLLQSRLYNTSGGTTGAQAESKLYRDLIQREISALENAPNLWKTRHYVVGSDEADCIKTGYGFGGYEDWIYSNFDPHISIRTDHADDYEDIEIGTYGICICCAEENRDGVYCTDCENGDRERCEDCGNWADDDDMYTVRDRHGNSRWVCESCRDRYYTFCDRCEEYHPNDCVTCVDGTYLCDDCAEEFCTECADCGELHLTSQMPQVVNSDGDEVRVCQYCFDRNYEYCSCCDSYVHGDYTAEAHTVQGSRIQVCTHCAENYFVACEKCGDLYPPDALIGGLCPGCQAVENEANDDNDMEVSA